MRAVSWAVGQGMSAGRQGTAQRFGAVPLRNLFRLVTAYVLGVCLLGLPLTVAWAQEPIRVLRLSTVDNNPTWVRRVSPVLREAYRRLNYGVEIIELPLRRGVELANEGNFDGDLGRLPTVESEFHNLERVPTKITDYPLVPVVLKAPGHSLATYELLLGSGLKIGTPFGSQSPVARLPGLKIETPASADSVLKMLALSRIDVAVLPKGVLHDRIPAMPPEIQALLAAAQELSPLETRPLYHYLHKRNHELVGLVDLELQKMARDGTTRRLLADSK